MHMTTMEAKPAPIAPAPAAPPRSFQPAATPVLVVIVSDMFGPRKVKSPLDAGPWLVLLDISPIDGGGEAAMFFRFHGAPEGGFSTPAKIAPMEQFSFPKLFMRIAGIVSIGIIGLRLGEAVGFDGVHITTESVLVSLAGVALWVSSERDWGKRK